MKLHNIISNEYAKFEKDWSGYLYRAGATGIFYHTSIEGALFYGENVKKYETPRTNKVFVMDLEIELGGINKILNKTTDEILEYDLALGIEDSLPIIKKRGYEAVVIIGETGAGVYGVPIEVVYWGTIKELQLSPDDISEIMGI